MGAVIEHPDNGDSNIEVIRVGDTESRVPLKVYQDIYHQVTGRTEQVRKRYSDNLLVEFAELEQLHFKIQQLCDVHKIIACNETISVFHEKERKEQFTSFERFRAYNANAASPTLSVLLKYNFSLIPAGLDRPQEYTLSIRLTSRVALLQQIEREAPPMLRGHLASIVATNTAEVTIDYADYVIARGFLEAFDEWIRGCNKTPSIPWLDHLRGWSHFVPGIAKFIAGGLVTWFAFQSIPVFFSAPATPEIWARFLVVYGGGAFLLVTLFSAMGNLMEQAIDGYPILSYLKLNKGDSNLIAGFGSRKRSALYKFALSSGLSIILGIISAKLERLV